MVGRVCAKRCPVGYIIAKQRIVDYVTTELLSPKSSVLESAGKCIKPSDQTETGDFSHFYRQKKKAESEQMDRFIDLTAEECIRTSILHLTLFLNTR